MAMDTISLAETSEQKHICLRSSQLLKPSSDIRANFMHAQKCHTSREKSQAQQPLSTYFASQSFFICEAKPSQNGSIVLGIADPTKSPMPPRQPPSPPTLTTPAVSTLLCMPFNATHKNKFTKFVMEQVAHNTCRKTMVAPKQTAKEAQKQKAMCSHTKSPPKPMVDKK